MIKKILWYIYALFSPVVNANRCCNNCKYKVDKCKYCSKWAYEKTEVSPITGKKTTYIKGTEYCNIERNWFYGKCRPQGIYYEVK